MNPRVSRSSALASKATGFPIAKVAALLAVGYTLDELQNDITNGKTPASFEPTIDYVVTKIPRFNFEKFPEADPRLSTQMKSVVRLWPLEEFPRIFSKSNTINGKRLDGLVISSEKFRGQWALKLELSTPGEKGLVHCAMHLEKAGQLMKYTNHAKSINGFCSTSKTSSMKRMNY